MTGCVPILVHNYKNDIKQVRQAAREAGLNTDEMKEAFQCKIEILKHSSGKRRYDNYSYKRLLEIAKEVKSWFENKTFGWFSLILRGELLNLREIEMITGVSCSRFIPKESGTSASHSKDTWIYKVEYRSIKDHDLSIEINKALASFLDKFEKINYHELKKSSDEAYVTIYVCSDNAQIGFTLDNKLMQRLYNLGIDIEYSIMSMGLVEE